ncbi:unnamed protein product [Mesocestoides corti]|uniref:Ig-like domain-containing protein n=1 Tax=Mesocestoides corti TaxID=53468 RepID=A0A0R3UDH5_MESCO|nr:unnamed protein product [Mesocestoides corti]
MITDLEHGPCFLNTYSEAELTETRAWGDDVSLDCESVAVGGLAERIAYTWIFHPHSSADSSPPAPPTPPPDAPEGYAVYFNPDARKRASSALKEVGETPADVVARFTGSTLRIRRITLAHAGEYLCSVSVEAKIGEVPGALTIGKLSRAFRLRVQRKFEWEVFKNPCVVRHTPRTILVNPIYRSFLL